MREISDTEKNLSAESRSVLLRRDRNQGGTASPAAGDRCRRRTGGTGQRRAAREARGKREGTGPSVGFKRGRRRRGGRAQVALVACRPFPFRRPVNGSPRRCPRKPHESLSASQAMPAVAAVHRHGHCCYRLRLSLPLLAVSCPLRRSLPSQLPPPARRRRDRKNREKERMKNRK